MPGGAPKLFGTRDWAEILGDNLVWFLLVFSLVVMGMFQPAFFSANIMKNILVQASALGVMTMGLAHVLMLGQIDLSIVGAMAFSAGMGTYLIRTISLHWLLAIVFIVVFGCFIGLINGLIITKLRAAALIETLAMNLILTGGLLALTQGRTFTGFPAEYVYLGKGTIWGIPVMPIPFILIALALSYMWNRTVFGRSLIATGGNRGCARVSGIAVDRVSIYAFVISGGLSAFSGYMMSSYMGAVPASFGATMQMYALAAAVIGGVSLSGGIGRISGVFGGVLLITIYQVGLQILGISPYYVNVAGGMMILFAVILDALKNKYRETH